MAQCEEPLPLDDCNKLLGACNGLAVVNVWRSVDPCIFLEVGRLAKRKNSNTPEGQICFMVECDWRVEKPRSIQFGSGFSDRRINNQMTSLLGVKIEAVEIVGTIPEIVLRFDDNRRFITFTNWTTQPRWTIMFHDRSLIPLNPLWDEIDVTPYIHVLAGRTKMGYCWDHSSASARKAVKRMGFRQHIVSIEST